MIAGVPTNSADIVMSRSGEAGSITGQVVDTAGRPIEGAEIRVRGSRPGFLPDSTVAPRRANHQLQGPLLAQRARHRVLGGHRRLSGVCDRHPRDQPADLPVGGGSTATVDFELPASSADTPHPPRQLGALAFTFPTTMTRSPSAYEAIRDRILRQAWGSRYEKLRAQRQSVRGRSAPAGSLIEVELSWSAPGDPDIIGYYIGRSPRENTGYQLQDDLLNPHAGF